MSEPETTYRRGPETRHSTAPSPGASAAVIAFYAVATLFCFRPLLPWSSAYLPRGGIGDPTQMLWFLSYTPDAITHGMNLFSTNLIDYPSGVDLANNTSVPLLGLLGWPITATLGPIATFNLLVRLGILLSASSMYFALGRWCKTTGARVIGGLCFGFGPYVIGQTVANTHLNLLFVPLLPVIVVGIEEAFIRQRWSARRTAATLGLAASGQMLIAPELLSDLLVVAAIVLVLACLRHPRAIADRVPYTARALGGAIVIFGVFSGYLIYEMVAAPSRLRGAVYPVAHLQAYRNTLGETLIPTMQEALSTTRIAALLQAPTKDLNELGGYLSIPLVVFLIFTAVVYRRRYGVAPFTVGAIVAFVLSLGGTMHLGAIKLTLPESVLTHLPLLNSTIPSRFSLETLIGASVLLALGADGIWQQSQTLHAASKRAAQWATVVSVAVILSSIAPRIPIAERKVIWTTAFAEKIARHVSPGAVVLAYPYPLPPYDQAMAWQAVTGFSYSLLGAYATVPGAAGSGQEWPITQQPIQVQRHLAELELLRHSPFPKTTTPISREELCAFLANDHVTDIVVTRYGARENQALSYLASAPHRTLAQDGPLYIFKVTGPPARGEHRC